MADTYTLDAQPRTVIGKQVRQLRNVGLIPAVIYGSHTQPLHVQIPVRELELTLRKAGGTHLINLNLGYTNQTVIAREVQRHILRGSILHVDFLAVDASTKLRTEVQLHFINESPAVRAGIGVLLIGISSIEIEVLSSELMDSVNVDLSSLVEVNDSVHVRDLGLGDKVTVITPEDEMIARVIIQAVQDEGPAPEISSSEPEVIKKGKIDEEGDE